MRSMLERLLYRLDNILYKGNKKYEVGLNDQQLNWVKSYLQYVPKGAHLFVCMHAPAYFYNENYKLGRVAELLDLSRVIR